MSDDTDRPEHFHTGADLSPRILNLGANKSRCGQQAVKFCQRHTVQAKGSGACIPRIVGTICDCKSSFLGHFKLKQGDKHSLKEKNVQIDMFLCKRGSYILTSGSKIT